MSMFSPPAMPEPPPLEWLIVREVHGEPRNGREGFTLGSFFFERSRPRACFTLEDQDRHLEDGNGKVYGVTAMPLGRYELELYNSPKHGIVPLFKTVSGFKFTEIHKANNAEQLQGCVAVGEVRTLDGVASCAPSLAKIVLAMHAAKAVGRRVFCTIERISV